MVYISKVKIPGKQEIGSSKDGYMYEDDKEEDKKNESQTWRSKIGDIGIQKKVEENRKEKKAPMSVPTAPIYQTPTVLPQIKNALGVNIAPTYDKKDVGRQLLGSQIKDSLGISKKIDESSERTQAIREHFQYLKSKDALYLNDKQTDYIKRFKTKYPDYADAPDAVLYGKLILADPKVMDKYGNINDNRNFFVRIGEAGATPVQKKWDRYAPNIKQNWEDMKTFKSNSDSLYNTSALVGNTLGLVGGSLEGFLGVGEELLNTVGDERREKQLGQQIGEGISRGVSAVVSPVVSFGKGALDVADAAADKVVGVYRAIIPDSMEKDFRDFVLSHPDKLQEIADTLDEVSEAAKYNLETGLDASNLLAFLSPAGVAKAGGASNALKTVRTSAREVVANGPSKLKKITGGRLGGEVSTEAFEAGVNKGITGGLSTGATTTREWLRTLPPEKQAIAPTIEKNVVKNRDVLEGIRNTQTGEKILSKADDRGFDPIDDVSRYEELRPDIDSDGRIDTTRAIDNLNAFVEPDAKTVRNLIEAEKKRISFDKYIKETRDILESRHLDDPDYDRWLKYIDDTLESYRNKKGYVDQNGTIALEKIDDIKKTIANKKVNYLNENDPALKAIAEGARKTIEKNVQNADIKKLNNELARWYTTRDYLKSIGVGKTIKGGRMGKYFAKLAGQGAGAVAGGMVGGPAGAFVGGAVGGEVADLVQGRVLSGAMKGTGKAMPESQLFGEAKKTLGESPKQLMPGTEGLPTSYSSRYSRVGEQLGQGEFPGTNNTGFSDKAIPQSVTPVVSGPGKSLAVSIDNGTIDIKKALAEFDKLTPEEKAKALQGSDKLAELVKVTTEIKDIQEFKGDFGYMPPDILKSLGDNYLTYSPEAKEMIRKGLDKEDLAALQKINREKAGLTDEIDTKKGQDGKKEIPPLPKKIADLENDIEMMNVNAGDRTTFMAKYGDDGSGTAGSAYDAVRDMDRYEIEDYASLWSKPDKTGAQKPVSNTAKRIMDDIDMFADEHGMTSDEAITLIREGTGDSRYKQNLEKFKSRWGVAPYEAKKKLAQFTKAWNDGKNPSIDDFLYKPEKTVDFDTPSKEEMGMTSSKTPWDDEKPQKWKTKTNPENLDVQNITSKYVSEKLGRVYKKPNLIDKIDVQKAKKLSDEFERMKVNDIENPRVQKSYDALAKETLEQYKYLEKSGYKIEPWVWQGQPYKNSTEMARDVADNKHLYFFKTDDGFGSSDVDFSQHPLLKDSGITLKGHKMKYNDLLRAVHDIFGHASRGNQFGAVGEENAWRIHRMMFSDDALPALTSETRGQNNWVNFNKGLRTDTGAIIKKGDPGYIPPSERKYADQKFALLPDEFVFPEIAQNKSIIDSIKKNGGITFDLKTSKNIRKGFAVSPYPERSLIIKGDITNKQLADWIEKNIDLLDLDGHSIGGWVDGDTIYLDVSITTKNRQKAIDLAKKYNQKAIRDLYEGIDIDTGGTGLAL